MSDNRRVYVGNLAWVTRWKGLKDVFKEIGAVRHADVLTDRTGRSKGCGIVEFENAEDAQRAIQELNDREIDGRKIFVREDREQQPRGGAVAAAAEGDVEGAGVATGATRGGRGGYSAFGGRYQQRGGFRGGNAAAAGGAGASTGGGRPLREVNQANVGKQLFVNGLPEDATLADLTDLFSTCGQVVRGEIKTDTRTGKSKGFATILLKTREEAQDAINSFDGTEFHGQRIQVKLDRFPQ